MGRGSRLVAIGGWLLCGASASAHAQPLTASAPPVRARAVHVAAAPVAPVASGASAAPSAGLIEGTVWDERGVPIAGAVVTAIGSTTTFGVTNGLGRFEIIALPAGSYLLRALAQGYSPRSQRIVVRSSGRSSSRLALRRVGSSPTILAAGIGAVAAQEAAAPGSPTSESLEAWASGGAGHQPATPESPDGEDLPETGEATTRRTDETVWRLRHARRGVLKDARLPVDLLADEDGDRARMVDLLGRAVSSPARVATNFFADVPFTGQVHFLTASMFETPHQLLARTDLARGIAYVKVTAPVGDAGDWTVRGALTQADLASWVVAGTYRSRTPQRHQYNLGLSYSTQAYGGGHPLALREVTEGSRNVGELFGFDTFTVSPAWSFTYGARYAHYDYLDRRGLLSPSVSVTVTPGDRLRVNVSASSRADAPGASEFAQPNDDGIWLPPQRTFSAIDPGAPFGAERTTQVATAIERDLGRSTVSVRGFRQDVNRQLVTVFGAELPNYDSVKLGHYFVGSAGTSQATGGTLAVRSTIAGRVQASVAYTLTSAQLASVGGADLVLLAPVMARPASERLQDLTTAITADVPETSTRILVLYRVGNGYSRAPSPGAAEPATGVDSRFDVQIRQPLPFLNFTNARWEMLIAVRNFLREAELDQSTFDELLTIRPPKRLVGGVTLHF
mgnify:CR=1 FL=1